MNKKKKEYRVKIGNLYYGGGYLCLSWIQLVSRPDARVFISKKNEANIVCRKITKLLGDKCIVTVEEN